MLRRNVSWATTLFVIVGICCMISGCSCRKGPTVVDIDQTTTKVEPEPVKQEPVPTKTPRIGENTIELPDENLKTVHFDYDKYVIRDDAAVVLKGNADWIKANMDKGEFLQIKIEGHCDERGTNKYNQVLGDRRANAVRNFLINEGIPGTILVPVSYGEDKPVDTRSSEEAWAKNRRGEFKKIVDASK